MILFVVVVLNLVESQFLEGSGNENKSGESRDIRGERILGRYSCDEEWTMPRL